MPKTPPRPAPPSPKIRRTRVVARLPVALRDRLAKYSAATGQSERMVLENALARELDGFTDTQYLYDRLDQLDRALRENTRDLQVLSEAFGRFLRLWFAAHAPALVPEVAPSSEASAKVTPGVSTAAASKVGAASPAATAPRRMTRAEAEAIYGKFAKDVGEHLARGHRLVDDMPDRAAGTDETAEG